MTMLTLDPTSWLIDDSEDDQLLEYPDEVLDAEWNPVLTLIQSIPSTETLSEESEDDDSHMDLEALD
jgi:hypothetical protein